MSNLTEATRKPQHPGLKEVVKEFKPAITFTTKPDEEYHGTLESKCDCGSTTGESLLGCICELCKTEVTYKTTKKENEMTNLSDLSNETLLAIYTKGLLSGAKNTEVLLKERIKDVIDYFDESCKDTTLNNLVNRAIFNASRDLNCPIKTTTEYLACIDSAGYEVDSILDGNYGREEDYDVELVVLPFVCTDATLKDKAHHLMLLGNAHYLSSIASSNLGLVDGNGYDYSEINVTDFVQFLDSGESNTFHEEDAPKVIAYNSKKITPLNKFYLITNGFYIDGEEKDVKSEFIVNVGKVLGLEKEVSELTTEDIDKICKVDYLTQSLEEDLDLDKSDYITLDTELDDDHENRLERDKADLKDYAFELVKFGWCVKAEIIGYNSSGFAFNNSSSFNSNSCNEINFYNGGDVSSFIDWLDNSSQDGMFVYF